MINKRVKEGITKFKTQNKQIKFCLGTLALMTMCVVLLIISTFTQIKIDATESIGMNFEFEYIPQIPIVMFVTALLGDRWGFLTILIYIILGLTPYFPIFALGGGLSYIFQYSFGYIFGYIFAVVFAGKELKKEKSFFNIIFASLKGVALIHIIGILYLTIIALIKHDSVDYIKNMIFYRSLSKILYDIVFSIISIIIAKGCRKVLWLIMG